MVWFMIRQVMCALSALTESTSIQGRIIFKGISNPTIPWAGSLSTSTVCCDPWFLEASSANQVP